MSVSLIWAEARGGVIGYDGAMPWHLPEDLAHFRELTGDGAVLMGRRTWESLPERFRPLPGRRNLVLTRDPHWSADGAEAVHDLTAVLSRFTAPDAALWVIGGGELYRATMSAAARGGAASDTASHTGAASRGGAAAAASATRLEVTELDLGVKGDTFAPPIDASWTRLTESPWLESKTGIRYRFVTYAR